MTAVTLDASVEATVQAAATLDAALSTATSAAVSSAGEVDTTAMATSVVEAYGVFYTTVETQAAAINALSEGRGDASVGILIVSEGSFRASK